MFVLLSGFAFRMITKITKILEFIWVSFRRACEKINVALQKLFKFQATLKRKNFTRGSI
jgi:hypothetical protein